MNFIGGRDCRRGQITLSQCVVPEMGTDSKHEFLVICIAAPMDYDPSRLVGGRSCFGRTDSGARGKLP